MGLRGVGAARRAIRLAGVSRLTLRQPVLVIRGGERTSRFDEVAGEEPLEIRFAGRPLAVTMRTPGDDFDLVAGFCWSEGIITDADASFRMRYGCSCALEEDVDPYNVVDVLTEDDHFVLPRRSVLVSSACGVCGTPSIHDVRRSGNFAVADDPTRFSSRVLMGFPARLREAQVLFARTGGVHAAGLFGADGALLAVREDVGRHNAVDKIVGWAVRERRLPLSGTALMVSGRASYELVQKAYLAGIPLLAAVSAPSSAAVRLAHDVGMSLVGFLRDGGMNVYVGGQRIVEDR